jgi:hypothetical protein
MLHNVRISTFRSSFSNQFQYALRTSTGAASSQTRGLRSTTLLDNNSSSLRWLSSSGAQHQQLLDVAPTAHLAMSSGVELYKSTQMMTSANTEDPWIDSSFVPMLGG